MRRDWMGRRKGRGTIRGTTTLLERQVEIIELQHEGGQLRPEGGKEVIRTYQGRGVC